MFEVDQRVRVCAGVCIDLVGLITQILEGEREAIKVTFPSDVNCLSGYSLWFSESELELVPSEGGHEE